ncbi:MAG: YbhB/YbcL family Raf kinase inhibitor-like protein [Myxococcaceae bacterium]
MFGLLLCASLIAGETKPMSFTVTSPDFQSNGAIPKKHTCEGGDVSPALQWSGAPAQTASFVVIVDDPDAPDPAAPKTVWVHWVLYNLPPTTTSLPEGLKAAPAGARDGVNDWKKPGYRGPCPPVGKHRYFHKVYALDLMLPELGAHATKADVVKAMNGHVLGQAELVGTYQKTK